MDRVPFSEEEVYYHLNEDVTDEQLGVFVHRSAWTWVSGTERLPGEWAALELLRSSFNEEGDDGLASLWELYEGLPETLALLRHTLNNIVDAGTEDVQFTTYLRAGASRLDEEIPVPKEFDVPMIRQADLETFKLRVWQQSTGESAVDVINDTVAACLIASLGYEAAQKEDQAEIWYAKATDLTNSFANLL